jgi:hypothetical protein
LLNLAIAIGSGYRFAQLASFEIFLYSIARISLFIGRIRNKAIEAVRELQQLKHGKE